MAEDTAPAGATEETPEARRIRERIPDAIVSVDESGSDTRIMIRREHIVEVCRLMRDDPDLQYNFFSECLGVDYLDRRPDYRFEVVYNLYSIRYGKEDAQVGTNRRIFLKVGVPGDEPVTPSVVEVYPGAGFTEREVYDMFGIRFTGHPDLRRLLMADDWVGHPQRKDYPLGGERVQFPAGTRGPAVEELPVQHAGDSFTGKTGDDAGQKY